MSKPRPAPQGVTHAVTLLASNAAVYTRGLFEQFPLSAKLLKLLVGAPPQTPQDGARVPKPPLASAMRLPAQDDHDENITAREQPAHVFSPDKSARQVSSPCSVSRPACKSIIFCLACLYSA